MNHFDPQQFQPQALVVGNGDLSSASLVRHWAERAPYIACCDGAANQLEHLAIEPDLIIGDLDSLSPEAARRYANRTLHITEQAINDQTKAVRHLHELMGMDRIVIVGGTGRREDHTIGNISLLIHYLRHGVTVLMATPYGIFVPCNQSTRLSTRSGQQVSIFNFNCTQMKGESLKYPLSPFDMLWQGTLNEALADTVAIHADGFYLVYLAN